VTFTPFLTSGVDNNLFTVTGLEPFGFQQGEAVSPPPPPPPGVTPPEEVFNPELILPPEFPLGVGPDTPGDAWYRWSAVNLQYPTDPLGGAYSLGGSGGPQGLETITPAASGQGGGDTRNDCANQFLGNMNASCGPAAP
jgi:hypothetical protein